MSPIESMSSIAQDYGDGIYYLHVQARDAAGNESVTETVSMVMDNTPPQVSIDNKYIFWSWICDDTPCEFRFVVNNQPFYRFRPGESYSSLESVTPGEIMETYYVHVQGKDEAGNSSSVVVSTPIAVFEDDTTAPTVSGATLQNIGNHGIGDKLLIELIFNEPVVFSSANIFLGISVGGKPKEIILADASDALAGAAINYSFSYTIQEGDTLPVEISSLIMDAENDVIQDIAGNSGDLQFSSVTLLEVTLDTVRPTLILDNDGVNWIWSCSENCVYRYIVNQSAEHSFAADDNYNINTASLLLTTNVGTSYLHLQARDNVGNESDVMSNSYFFAGALGFRTIETTAMGWAWNCSPVDDCESRFAISRNQSTPAEAAFSSFGLVNQAFFPKGSGTYYLHLQVREISDTSSISEINSSADSIVVKSYLRNNMTVGYGHACVVKDGPVCWGKNNNGQLGINNTTHQSYPSLAIDTSQISGGKILQLYAGEELSCAVVATVEGHSRASCWGYGFDVGVGYFSNDSVNRPIRYIEGNYNGIITLDGGRDHFCGIRSNGQVLCWGRKSEGRIGDGENPGGSSITRPVTVRVYGDSNFLEGAVYLAIGEKHSCAALYDGTVWCWGKGEDGAIGDGYSENRYEARQVLKEEDHASERYCSY